MSTILDGKALAAKLKEDLAKEINSLKEKHHHVPRILSLSFGQHAASQSYITSQQKTAESLGIHYTLEVLKDSLSQTEALSFIQKFNNNPEIHGIIINKPLPSALDFYALSNAIVPSKDIEGMNLANLGMLLMYKTKLWPCTPAGALALLKSSGVVLQGKTAVVLGRSEIVGKPMVLLLLAENMTVTVCHSKTVDLKNHLQQADVVIAAIGQPLFVKGDWIKPQSIIIDVGINQRDGKIIGDVDFESCKDKASFITPVPGGVGPVTSVMLMKNAVEAFKQQIGVE
jgi:methylenetetrahydrofolate dehydrogenase (NADP+)/methenyltetrahydrofolate cyclohydrolase